MLLFINRIIIVDGFFYRQLLSGVDNLRTLAGTIENMDHNVEQSSPQQQQQSDVPTIDEFLSGCDEEDFTGPAL